MSGALLLALTLTSGGLDDMVRIEPADGPPPTGAEPLITLERGPFSASLGGYLRVGSEGTEGFDVCPLVYTRGEILPLLAIRYDIELFLPGARGGDLGLRTASISMQLASTPAFGAMHLGVLPVPFGLDSQRLRPDQPLLALAPVAATFGFASRPGFLVRLDHRSSLVPLLAEVGVFDLPEANGLRRFVTHARIEASLWGTPESFRSLRVGNALALVGDSVDRHLRILGYAHFRFERVLLEGELCHASLVEGRGTARAWHALAGFDLLPEFLELLAGVGETRGVASLDGAVNGAFVTAGARLFVVRRRLVVSFQWRGDSYGPGELDLDGQSVLSAFDLRF